MTTDRRSILQGLTGAALLAPTLAAECAMAAQAAYSGAASTPRPASAPANPSLAEQKAMADKHMEAMSRVLGPGLFGKEEIAMLVYPKFTALDLVGPHYFFACLFGAKVHLVTTEKDLSAGCFRPRPRDHAHCDLWPMRPRISTCCSCPAAPRARFRSWAGPIRWPGFATVPRAPST